MAHQPFIVLSKKLVKDIPFDLWKKIYFLLEFPEVARTYVSHKRKPLDPEEMKKQVTHLILLVLL